MTQRQDQLSECNVSNEPLQIFQEAWCRRCVAPECVRSLFGQSRFDIRVNTWEERLFKNPPKMSPDDSRYRLLAAQRFITIDPGRTPELHSSNWVDPLRETSPEAVLGQVVVSEPIITEVQVSVGPKEPISQCVVSPSILLMNAKSQSGRTLSGVEGIKTKRDAWVVPESAENVVPLGATVKFGGSGVKKD